MMSRIDAVLSAFRYFVVLTAVIDGTYGDQNTQFAPLRCNNTAICAFSEPLTLLYSVLSVTSCATECYFKQYQSAPCVGFNYRATNKSCDIFNENPRFFDQEEGCQYYQNTRNANSNCTHLPGLHLMGPLVTSLPGSQTVYATALLDGTLFVSRNGNVPQISVYDTTSFNLLRTITFTGLGPQIYGLATSATSNCLFVGSTSNKLHRIDLSVTSSVSVFTWSVTGIPYGLSLTSTGNVLVSIYYASCVREFTLNGSLVRTIAHNGNTLQAMELRAGLWAILTPSSLCTVPTNGSVVKCFKPLNVGSQLRFFVIDSNGYYVVADSSDNALLIVDPFLTDARRLQLPVYPALQSPIALSLDQPRGRLYVGEYISTQYRVLVFDGVW